MTGAPDRRSLMPPHLGDAQLVAYLDGELSRADLEIARAHVETCWTCRSRLSSLLTSIETFLASRADLQPDASAGREQRIHQFRERLARHAAEVEAHLSLGKKMWGRWNAVAAAFSEHRRAALAGLVAACLLIAMFTDIFSSRVSADTVLARAAGYEASSHPEPGEVERLVVQVERIDRRSGAAQNLGVITIVRDSQSPGEIVSIQSASGEQRQASLPDSDNPQKLQAAFSLIDQVLPQSIAAYLEGRHWQPNFSVSGFHQLIAARGSSASTAEKQGTLFALHFPFAPGHESGIAEAQLLVEGRNYAPVGLSFFTADAASEYRFTRTTMAIEPRTTELARLFDAPSLPQKARVHAVPELPKTVPLSYQASQASPEEVRLAAALHQADACLGEEIHIFPMSDGSLLVQGLVDQAERRDAIRQAVRAVDPALRTEIYLPRELKSGAQLYRPPYQVIEPASGVRSTASATLADLSSQRMPMYEELYHHFAKPGVSAEEAEKQINAFSSEAVTLARQTFLHAWALKKLDDEFSPRRAFGLPAANLQQVEQMRQDHRRWIATLSHRQAEMLSQVTHGGTSPTFNADALARLSSDSDALIRLAQEQNDLVRSLFTVSTGTVETESTLSRLLAVLHRMGA